MKQTGSAINFACDTIEFIVTSDQADIQAAPDDVDLGLPIIRTDEDLDAFLLTFFGVVLPSRCICEHRGHRTPHEAFHDAYFGRCPVAVWKASRGFGGKSFTLALLAMTEAITLKADVNVLGGSGEQSKRILDSQVKLWQFPNAPRGALNSEPGAMRSELRWGNKIVALLASQKSVRGPHPQRLRMDEVDEMDQDILRSALGQPMSKGPVLSQVVLSSTHQYADGTMTWALEQARIMGWPIYEWCLEETREANGGWVAETEIVRKRATMTILDWETEVELQEPTNEDPAIFPEIVGKLFDAQYHLEAAPEPGGKYAHGADWAKSVNLTSITSLRKAKYPIPMVLVAMETTGRQPWPSMVEKFNERVRLFKGPAAHDATGLGTVIDDYLTVDAEGFEMVGKARKALFSECIAGLEHFEVMIPDVPQREIVRLRTVLKNLKRKDLYGSGHPPDEFVSLALAYHAASQAEGGGGQMVHPPGHAEQVSYLTKLAPDTPQVRPSDRIFGRRRPGGLWRKDE